MSEKVTVLPERGAMDARDQWHLQDIFASDALWEEAFSKTQGLIAPLSALEGTLSASPESLKKGLDLLMDASLGIEKLYVYARMRRDEDNGKELYQQMADRAMQLSVRMSEATAFVTPEILDIPWAAEAAEKDEAGLKLYRRFLHDILRQKAHTLPPEQERLLAMAGDMAGACDNIFTMLNNADIRFGSVPDGQGGQVELTHGRYSQLMENPDRAVREAAYKAMYDAYGKQINTLAAVYGGSVKKDVFYARARKYPSALAAALDSDAVDTAVYDALCAAIRKHLPLLHRYMDLRAKLLKVDPLKMYDVYVPLVAESDRHYTYEEAKEMVLRAVRPMGEDYVAQVQKGLSEGWVDVYENRGKTSGAYSWGVYGTHPYILMNYQGTTDHVFTLAHEMGHAMHSFYSNSSLPFVDAGYSIMVAEVASTVNEQLLLREMQAHTQSPEEKAYLLNHALEQVRATVFRQVMFAEFEREAHRMAQEGEALTPEALSAYYAQLNRDYYGAGVDTDADIAIEWARIPHFYNAFYVYQYATGYSSAVLLAQDLLTNGKDARQRYRTFLSSGGSDDPIRLLQNAGVDLTGPKPVEACMAYFEQCLNEFEELMKQTGRL